MVVALLLSFGWPLHRSLADVLRPEPSVHPMVATSSIGMASSTSPAVIAPVQVPVDTPASASASTLVFPSTSIPAPPLPSVAKPLTKPVSSAMVKAADSVPPAPRAPSASAPPAASARVEEAAAVRIHDRRVFVVRVGRAGVSAEERARTASQVLEKAVEEPEAPEVRIQEQADVAVLFVGDRPAIQLGEDDAEASGDVSLSVHAASISTKVRDAIRAERNRSAIAQTVFSFSLLIFSALIGFLLVRKISELLTKTSRWLEERPERFAHWKVQGIEILSPTAVRGSLSIALSAGKLLIQLGILYAWVLVALSLFDATRAYSDRLTGVVLTPLSELTRRLASSLPVLFVVSLALLAIVLLVRFVGLFFSSVARGETNLDWLPSDLAISTGVLVRAAILIASVVFVLPTVTGNPEGAIAHTGTVALAVVGLASTPLMASAIVGIAVVYGRKVKIGEFADVGGRFGRVIAITLLEIRLEDREGCEVRIPHLLALIHPTRLVGRMPLVQIDISVGAPTESTALRELLLQSTKGLGVRPKAYLIALDGPNAWFCVSMNSDLKDAQSRLLLSLAAALSQAGVPIHSSRASENRVSA